MSWLLQILSLLNQLQSYPLTQEIEQCIFAGGSAAAIWQCIESKLTAANLPPGTIDAAVADAARVVAGHAGRARWGVQP